MGTDKYGARREHDWNESDAEATNATDVIAVLAWKHNRQDALTG